MAEPLEEKSLHSHRGTVTEEGIVRKPETTEHGNGIIHRPGVPGQQAGDPSLLHLPAEEENALRTFPLALVKPAPRQKGGTTF